jgi:hypothetical protein
MSIDTNIRMVFIGDGRIMIIGELINTTVENFNANTLYELKNPAQVLFHKEGVGLIPILELCEEDTMVVSENTCIIRGVFTPKIELINAYNSIYGSGIIVPDTASLGNIKNIYN